MLHTCKSAILSASGSTTDARAIKQQSAAMAMNASGIRDTARAARQSHHRDSFLGAACLSWQGKERLVAGQFPLPLPRGTQPLLDRFILSNEPDRRTIWNITGMHTMLARFFVEISPRVLSKIS